MIEFQHISKLFGSTRAVYDFNLNINEGEVVALIGPSGCGKSTTLKMVNRLIDPTDGRILIHGENIRKQNKIDLRRSLGYVVQSIGLMPHMTLYENVSLIARVQKKPKHVVRRRVEELLDLVQLPFQKYKNSYPKQLSGGQQQRVGIARALMNDPDLLLMDEPFGALDPITKSQLHAEMKTLTQKLKKTILIVTHDMDEAFQLADRIVLMNQGQIVQVGTQREFVEEPRNEFVKEFLQSQLGGK